MPRLVKMDLLLQPFACSFPSLPNGKDTFASVVYFSIKVLIMFTISGCGMKEKSSSDETMVFRGELVNASQLADSVKCLTPSPQWYKSLWLDINSKENKVGQRFMNHYMNCSGSTYHLSEEEFKSLPVYIVPNQNSQKNLNRNYIDALPSHPEKTLGEKIVDIDRAILAASHFGNTLGNFELRLKGVIVWRQNSMGEIIPRFEGIAKIFDRYDFNPSVTHAKDSWRGQDTEIRVRIAHIALPGKAFDISSEWMEFQFDLPKYDYDLINEGLYSESSGYSEYGEKLQAILAVELRSSSWDKSSPLEKLKIILRIMKKINEAYARGAE